MVAELVSELKLKVKLGLMLNPADVVLASDNAVVKERAETKDSSTSMILLDDNIRGDDVDDIEDTDEDDNTIDVAVPNFDPMENRLKALTPGQQLRLYRASNSVATSQHISPPSPGHLSEHPHAVTPPLL